MTIGLILFAGVCAYVLLWRRDLALERYVTAIDKLRAAKKAASETVS